MSSCESGKSGKVCFPDGKGKQTCFRDVDYFANGDKAESWVEEHKILLVSDEEYSKKPERK